MSVTVIMPATAKRLTTVANVRGDLGLTEDAAAEAQVLRWVDQASQQAATYCRRVFGRETVRERIDLCRHGSVTEDGGILLDRSPVASIASVKVGGTLQASDAYATDGRVLYRMEGDERRCWSGRDVVVQYEAGWLLPGEERTVGGVRTATEDLPADIERAVIQLVGVSASMAGRDITIKSEDVEGVGSRDFYVQGANAALPHPEAEAILSQYRRMLFA
ncbi:hypothetical protein ASG40_19370 [Methylobacterium sp. Leaf399]|uniref:hypothetical protein n=1 Tax=Methylobacterium sp. Leaf399 TaxID=1736364 RepID=UPI0006F32F29|nr:hypothetical protein [Methylobacterium sp. Leaf399]KQT13989.1 hypothetical protein ASG40_19370 [Methylobacterium sp. Leaf399]